MKTEIAQLLLAKYGKTNPPAVSPGDTVRVHQKIREGEKERIQIFEGLVIATKHGSGLDGSYTVRKMATGGVGVERVFPIHSPNVVKVERVKTAKVNRGKLYYMRGRLGKSARFKVEQANPAVWDESAAIAARQKAAQAAENEETVTEVEEMLEGSELVETEVTETDTTSAPEVSDGADETEAVEESADDPEITETDAKGEKDSD